MPCPSTIPSHSGGTLLTGRALFLLLLTVAQLMTPHVTQALECYECTTNRIASDNPQNASYQCRDKEAASKKDCGSAPGCAYLLGVEKTDTVGTIVYLLGNCGGVEGLRCAAEALKVPNGGAEHLHQLAKKKECYKASVPATDFMMVANKCYGRDFPSGPDNVEFEICPCEGNLCNRPKSSSSSAVGGCKWTAPRVIQLSHSHHCHCWTRFLLDRLP